jgi:hypothetical protein
MNFFPFLESLNSYNSHKMSIWNTLDLGLPKFSNCADLGIGTRTIFCHSVTLQLLSMPVQQQKTNIPCETEHLALWQVCMDVCILEPLGTSYLQVWHWLSRTSGPKAYPSVATSSITQHYSQSMQCQLVTTAYWRSRLNCDLFEDTKWLSHQYN